MAKGVFLHRAGSIYDDRPEERYQFPSQYLSRASQFVGDWVVYYEPVKAGKKGYFAIARVEEIVPDPTIANMYLALIEPGSYLPMEYTVPFNDHDGLVERGLLNESGKISGRAQAAVRPISLEDFNRILERGIPDVDDMLPRTDASEPKVVESHFSETVEPFIFDQERERISSISNRLVVIGSSEKLCLMRMIADARLPDLSSSTVAGVPKLRPPISNPSKQTVPTSSLMASRSRERFTGCSTEVWLAYRIIWISSFQGR